MIVKNEATVIERCLAAVLPLIDTWVIVDTGSTDGTQQRIRTLLRDIPGELHERQWKNFGSNRTEALELARGKGEYILTVDADEVLHVPADFRWPQLTADGYRLIHQNGNYSYWRTHLFADRVSWRYEGALHEYPVADKSTVELQLHGLSVTGFFDGGRSQLNPAEKYAADAQLLEAEVEADPTNTRNVFYLAQSYRDAGQFEKALRTYQRRSEMGGWEEEVWCALHQVALLSDRLRLDEPLTVARYLAAYQYRPRRAEPLVDLARYYRENGQRYAIALLFAQQAIAIERPDDTLFLDESAYSWRSVDEFAVATYWAGQYRHSASACRQLLATRELPEHEKPRILANLTAALDQLGEPPSA